MKNQTSRSMQKSKKKESGVQEDKSSGRKKPVPNKKKSGVGAHDDDNDSVDSHGNVRNLIVYSEEEEDDDSSSESYDTEASTLTPEMKTEIRRSARKAAQIASERIRRQKATKRLSKKMMKKKIVEEDEEEDVPVPVKSKKKVVEEEEDVPVKSKKKAKKVVEESEEEESDEYEEDEDEEDDEDYDEEEDDEDEENEYHHGKGGISISIGDFGSDDFFKERMTPKRHNMKKESDIVKKFVKLITAPTEDTTIDDQIDQFKTLTDEKQTQLIAALDRKATPDASNNLMFKILTMKLPPDTQTMVLAKYNSLQSMDPSSGEYYKVSAWLEKLTSLPLGIYKEMPAKLSDGPDGCAEFMNRASKCLNEAIYGQDEAKLQILQFIASRLANPTARGMSLLLAGPPGIGKTSLIKNGIAKALNWPFQFISLGGDSDASTYTGHQVVYEGSHCGKIVNSLISAKSMSLVMMFDEVDKISATPKGEEVGNLLIHLTDSVQNTEFEDKYLSGVPLDLSRVMFAFSANDLNKIDRVLIDRMVVVDLKGYSSKEKLAIAENFVVPQALKEINLDEKVSMSKEVLQFMIEEYAREEAGVRELKRCIEQIIQKINMLRIFNTKDLPFHIPGFQLPFVVKKEHVTLFLKKKTTNESISHLYT